MVEPDHGLAGRARHGDREALVTLYERHRRTLLGYLVRLTKDHALAEDLFQEVWMKAVQRIDQFEPSRGTFRGWIFRIANNAVVDRSRRDAVRRGPELDAPIGDSEERLIDRVATGDPDPERSGVSSEAGRALAAALENVPPAQKAAVLLRHQQGLSYQEIADVLKLPVGTAKSMVHRGVTALRRVLAEFEDV